MVRILIAEDDSQCFGQLKQFLDDYSRETGRIFQLTRYDNGEDLVERYRPEYDLLLLDIDMPFLDGMTAAEHIRQIDPEVVIVFVTNLAQYAIQGYSVNALDYILKPLHYFSFSQRLTRALRYVKKREEDYLTVAVKGGALKLEVRGIYYIERLGRQLMLHTRDGILASTATLQQLEEQALKYQTASQHAPQPGAGQPPGKVEDHDQAGAPLRHSGKQPGNVGEIDPIHPVIPPK